MVIYDNYGKEKARTLFSKPHLEKIKKYKWSVNTKGYSLARVSNKNCKLHHFIKGKPPKGLVTDHINRNKLDNRDENLRFVTQSENVSNCLFKISNCNKVYKTKIGKHTYWVSKIHLNKNKINKQIYFGYFK